MLMILLFKLLWFFLVPFSFILTQRSQPERKLVILHTNDMHSRLMGYAPESDYSPMTTNDDNTVGGFSRIASIIKSEKEKNECTTLVLDAGDFLMGTLFQGLETSTGFELHLMKDIGYDVVCLGNHEFDYGPVKLAEILRASSRRGKIPAVLSGNIVFNKREREDDSLENLFSEGILGRTYILERDGLKIGFFSLLGKEAVHDAAFASPVSFSSQIHAARKLVKKLKSEKCDLIICLSHSGVKQDDKGQWGGEDAELARKVKNIDVIISGHTHTKLDKPLMINGVPIVQAGCYTKFVGRLVLDIKDGKVTVDNYRLIKVDDSITGDTKTEELIRAQKKEVNKKILNPLGISYDEKIAETDFLLKCDEQGNYKDSNLGPLVADAIRNYINGHIKSGTDISMVAVGVIRDNIVPGVQTAPDIFRVMSMGSGEDGIPGYPLSRIYITGKELKSVLEILQVASKTPSNYCYYSGLKAVLDPERGMLRKIAGISVIHPDGSTSEVDFSKNNKTLYSVSANSYMLQFIGIIKKLSFGLINVEPKDIDGNKITDMKSTLIDIDEEKPGLQEGKEWLALLEYISSMKDNNGNGIPDIDKKYNKAQYTIITSGSK